MTGREALHQLSAIRDSIRYNFLVSHRSIGGGGGDDGGSHT